MQTGLALLLLALASDVPAPSCGGEAAPARAEVSYPHDLAKMSTADVVRLAGKRARFRVVLNKDTEIKRIGNATIFKCRQGQFRTYVFLQLRRLSAAFTVEATVKVDRSVMGDYLVFLLDAVPVGGHE